MNNGTELSERNRGGVDVLTLGFGTTVAMWLAGYLCRLPAVVLPSPVVLVLMLGCLIGGGYVAGSCSSRGVKGGIYGALLAAALNLLILGSLLSGETPNSIHPGAILWLPGWFILAAALGALGAKIGVHFPHLPEILNWTGLLVLTGVVATFLLIIVGGLVTSNDAGLAVVDWPNSFGYNMFLYPLSRMTGGIYYEHAHRLFGSLVGLTTLVITIHLFRTESRRGIKILTGCILAAVIFQGILGGLRVTGRFTLSTSQADVAPSLTLAVVHGVVGQVFLGMLTALAVFTSTAWFKGNHLNGGANSTGSARILDLWLSGLMVLLMVIQVFLGALQRHFAMALSYHITVASAIAILAVFIAARANGFYSDQRNIKRFAGIMVLLTGLQIILGLAALIATLLHVPEQPYTVIETLLPTAHQAAGAALLAVTVGLHLWMWRETGNERTR